MSSRAPHGSIRRHSSRSDPAGLPRGGLGGVELALDEVEAAVPEARVREVDADDPAQLLRRHRAAGRQQLEVRGGEVGADLLVAAVDREREQLPVAYA